MDHVGSQAPVWGSQEILVCTELPATPHQGSFGGVGLCLHLEGLKSLGVVPEGGCIPACALGLCPDHSNQEAPKEEQGAEPSGVLCPGMLLWLNLASEDASKILR